MRLLVALVLLSAILVAKAIRKNDKNKTVPGDVRLGESVDASEVVSALVHITTYDDTDEELKFCAGAIISADAVLTTANCVLRAARAELIAGSIDLEEENEGAQTVNSSRILIHPQFFTNTMESDIAIIKVKPAFNLTNATRSRVTSLPIPKSIAVGNDKMTKFTISVIGWSTPDEDMASNLEIISSMTVLRQKECEKQLKAAFYKLPLSAYCVEVSEYHNLCEHDKGSMGIAMVQSGKTTVPSLVGLASNFIGDCPSDVPDTFTRVADFSKWIADNSELKLI